MQLRLQQPVLADLVAAANQSIRQTQECGILGHRMQGYS